jgi:hypothetical protein
MDSVNLTKSEWLEIMQQPQVRAAWGIEVDEEVTEFSARVYAAKFDFHSGGPGYVGVICTFSKVTHSRMKGR